MKTIPSKIKLANLPTRIEKLERLTEKLGGPNIYIKRDDETGTEFSGNKIRKLEFAVKEALDQGCDMLITCGGIQSNHARATAAVAARLGIKSYLLLRGNDDGTADGNYFMDQLLGAQIKFVTPEEYSEKRGEIMEQLKNELIKDGYKPYIIPEGASNGIGTFGYFEAMEEIIGQENQLKVKFDAIVVAVGSGGTYGGVFLANALLNENRAIYGVNVSSDAEHFKGRILQLINDGLEIINHEFTILKDDIKIIDGYVGRGYALSRPEEIEFIKEFARLEGIILDPVYTGKAMYGLVNEIEKGTFKDHKNVLFIHTGGLYGVFPQKGLFY